jgi:microcystin-dependent protein
MQRQRQAALAGPIAAGFVTSYAGDLSVPASRTALAHAGWLVCDGASYAPATYPDLFAVIKNNHGGTATSFAVPDLRDRFVRGTNGSATYGAGPADPDVATRAAAAPGGATGNAVGSLEPPATAAPHRLWTLSQDPGHTHSFAHLTSSQEQAWYGSTDWMARNPSSTVDVNAGGAHGHVFAGGDSESAPVNVSLYWIIKATNA